MAFDGHANLAASLVATAPSPATSGTSLVVTAASGTFFPAVPFNATIWPAGTAAPTHANAEIVRVTNVTTDTLTVTRAQEGTSARTVVVGDQIAATITAKTLTDIESNSSDWLVQYVLGAGRSGGQSVIGGTGGSDILTLTGSSSSTHAGSLAITSKTNIYNVTETVTATTYRGLLSVAGTYTLNFVNCDFGTGTGTGVIDLSPTIIAQQSMLSTGMAPIRVGHTVKNLSSVNSIALAGASVVSRTTYTGDTQAGTTLQATADIFSSMTLTAVNSGTITASGDYVNFEARLAADATSGTVNLSGSYEAFQMVAPVLTNSPTVATVTGFRVAPHSAGSTASNGVWIGALTGAGANTGVLIAKPSGGTSNIGLQNSGATAFTPTTSTLTATTSTIDPSGTATRLANTSGGSLTLAPAASGPIIPDGVDGQILIVFNGGAQNVVLTDQGTQAGSNLRLATSGTPITLGQRDNITFLFSSTVGDWIEIARTNVI